MCGSCSDLPWIYFCRHIANLEAKSYNKNLMVTSTMVQMCTLRSMFVEYFPTRPVAVVIGAGIGYRY